MPVDPIVFRSVSEGELVSAEDIRSRFKHLETFVNGGIAKSDLKTGSSEFEKQIFNTRHIIRPEFYSIANTRIHGVSSDVFYRNKFKSSFNRYVRHEITGNYNTGEGGFSTSELNALPFDAWQPIDGMSCTVVVKGNTDVTAFVNGSLYAFGAGGNDGINTQLKDRYNDTGGSTEDNPINDIQRSALRRCLANGRIIAVFVLYVDNLDGNGPQKQPLTERRLFNRGERSYPFRKAQISFAEMITLTPGPNKVSYRCIYRMLEEDNISQKHVYIDNRNFFVDVHYK